MTNPCPENLDARQTTTTYAYNGAGLRTSKTTGATTTHFIWDQTGGSAAPLLTDGTNNWIYGPDGQALEQINGATTNYLLHNETASVVGLIDTTGAVVGTYTYNQYAQTTAHSGTATTPLQGSGQYLDNETGFTYLRARYYDPATAQFITRDPLTAVTRSPYGYVNGDPLNETDIQGLWGWNPINDAEQAGSAVGHAGKAVGSAVNTALPAVHAVANGVALAASVCAVVTSETVVGGVTCGAVALGAGGVSAATGVVLYAEGRESGAGLALDVGGLGLSGVGSLAELGGSAARAAGAAADTTSVLGRATSEFWGATADGLAFFSRALSAEGFGFGLYGVLCDP